MTISLKEAGRPCNRIHVLCLVELIRIDCLGGNVDGFLRIILEMCVCFKESKCEQLQLSETSHEHMFLFTKHVWATSLLRSFNLGNKHESFLFIFNCYFLLITFWADSIVFHQF